MDNKTEAGRVHGGHRERLRRRFLSEGLDNFGDHEIIELLLFYTHARGDTNPIAHELINHFGSFRAVCDAPYEELLKISGVGEISAALIKLIPQLAKRYAVKSGSEAYINTTEQAGWFLLPRFIGLTDETVIVVSLDNKCKVLGCTVLFQGSVNAAQVSTRKIIETVLRYNATGAIIAHNHPGGLALPSDEDIITTGKISLALKAIGVLLIDHIIVADHDFISLSDSGYL